MRIKCRNYEGLLIYLEANLASLYGYGNIVVDIVVEYDIEILIRDKEKVRLEKVDVSEIEVMK